MQIGGPKGEGPSGARKGSLDATRARGPGLLSSALGIAESPPPGGDAPANVQLSERVSEVEDIADRARVEPDVRPDVVEQALRDLREGRLVVAHHELAALIARDLF